MTDADLTPSEREIAESLRSLAQEPVTWADPSPDLWSRIETALPDSDRDEVQQRRERRSGRRSGATVSRRGLLAVAAGGLIAGTGLGAIGWRLLESRPAEVLATAELTPLDAPDQLGTAQVRRTRDGLVLELAAPTPFQVATGYIEVWLINVDGRRMVSVGIYQGNREESFPITPDLLKEGYVVVDLSREKFDTQPTHSGDSLVRGRLNL